MEDNSWFVGHINRRDAEMRLLHPLNEHGAFLIRCSESETGKFALSLRDGSNVKHYLIRRQRSQFFIIPRKKFGSLEALVDYYTHFADGLCVNLRHPCIMDDWNDEYETDRTSVKRVRKLGQGQFGQVWEGLWHNKTPVAIKSLKPGTMDPKDFLAEAQVMKGLQHPNLIQLYAICTLEEPIYIITELMINGSLLHFLRDKKRSGNLLKLPQLFRIASDICRGMVYLERENYIHRDLAARNVLLGKNNSVKIADFGLARLIKEDEYMARQGTKFPIKWTAPEAISSNKFSIKSDVWSFGILLTELVTHGDTPYGEEMSNLLTMTKVEQGYHMPAPRGCPPRLYAIMEECWKMMPADRPTFDTLQWKLDDFFTMDPSDYKEAVGYQDL